MPNSLVMSRHPAPRIPVPKTGRSQSSAISAEYREFAYIVSHDLQGPVRAMVEMSRLLLKDRAASVAEDEDTYLNLIMASGEKLQAMVMGLLAFSRLGSQVWQARRLDMDALVRRLIHTRGQAFKAQGGRMTARPLPVVHADPAGLELVFGALIDNALKFRRPEVAPLIAITADETRKTAIFCVSDNGIGVAPEFCEEIFKPLRKLHTDDAYPGTGMGLTLARRIIRAMGGDMWARPNAPFGLNVFFTLPHGEEVS